MRHVHGWARIVIQAVITKIADDPNDLAGTIAEIRPETSTDNEPIRQRIALRPEPFGHSLVDDHDGRRSHAVLIVECAPSQKRDLEYIEVTRSGDHVTPSAVRSAFERTSRDDEGKPDAAFQRHA